MSILAIPSLNRSLKLKPFGRNQQLWDTQTDRQTDIATTKLNRPRARFSKKYPLQLCLHCMAKSQ